VGRVELISYQMPGVARLQACIIAEPKVRFSV